jgi:hypothetical protein
VGRRYRREWIYARLTESGNQRIGELTKAGLEPSSFWSEETFDETGLDQP